MWNNRCSKSGREKKREARLPICGRDNSHRLAAARVQEDAAEDFEQISIIADKARSGARLDADDVRFGRDTVFGKAQKSPQVRTAQSHSAHQRLFAFRRAGARFLSPQSFARRLEGLERGMKATD